MIISNSRILSSLGAFVLCLSVPVHAADFDLVQDRIGMARIEIRGEIVAGDYDAFDGALERARNEGFEPGRIIVSLDSPGGLVMEALRIAERVYRDGIGTEVLEGDRCFSGCALIFMHGTQRFPDTTKDIRRRMATSAQVGFHGPYLEEGSEVGAGEAIALANFITGVTLGFSDNRQFPSSLAARSLQTPPDGLFFIDRIDRAGRWFIDLFPASGPNFVTHDMARTACWNDYNWARDLSALERERVDDRGFFIEHPPSAERQQAVVIEPGRFFRHEVFIGTYADNSCFIDFEVDEGRVVRAWISYNSEWAQDRWELPWHYLLDAGTPLVELEAILRSW